MKHFIILLFFVSAIFAQIDFQGRVINSTGDPIPGVNVYIENTSKGTATDSKGYFKLNIDSFNAKLVLSHLVFEKQVIDLSTIKNQNKIIFTLKEKVLSSQSVFVEAALGKRNQTPAAFEKIDRKEIEDTYTIQDVPVFLSTLPSSTFYSEGGAGIGYNYLTIRGFDQRRISASVNGIPQNDPEDHNIYWHNITDLLSSTGMIQVQRGAGSGVAGYPAVGGSINIITSPFSDKPRMDFGAYYGSYNTRKYIAELGSGLVNNKYSVYVKLSHTMSTGYKQLNWVDFKSYYVSAARYDEKLTTQINVYGGPISDGLTYTGVPKSFVKDKERRRDNYNWWGIYDGELVKTDRRPDEVESFSQPHFEILNEYRVDENLTLNSALFLILGEGYFDYDGSWADSNYFRLTKENGFNLDGNPENVLIRAMVENKHWGWIPRLSYKHKNGELIAGAEVRFHSSVHWGSLNYGANLPSEITKDYRYYYYEGGKDIFNFFVNESYNVNENLNILLEAQFAYHKYKIENEKYLDNEFEISDLFFNPRIGVNYKFNKKSNAYIAYARVNREPRLKNYYDAAESSGGAAPQFEKDNNGNFDWDNPLVKHETMNGFDAGYSYTQNNLNFNVNLFYMLFDNEIVKKGQLDRFGQPITGNMDKTVHSGIELSGMFKPSRNFEFVLNGTYSNNKILDGKTFIESGGSITELSIDDNHISGFPEIVFTGIVKFNYEGFSSTFIGKYVGDFYSDNYGENLSEYIAKYPGFIDYTDNKIDAYFATNLIVSYETKKVDHLQNLKVFVQVNNLFNSLYATNAIGKEFFPAAERHFLAGLQIGL